MPKGAWKCSRKPLSAEHKAKLSLSSKGVAKNPSGVLIPRSVSYRNHHLKRYHDKSIAQYQIDLVSQNGVCAVCLCPPKDTEVLVYDHNHKHCSGKKSCSLCLRQLLCHKCNRALGFFDDSIMKLENAIEYLRAHAKF